ncbi:MAG: hypothetical protein WCV50_03205 [Patescibacteria group bacterium]|jgi:hypothetical protein
MQIKKSIHSQQGFSTFWGVSVILIETIVVVFVFYFLYFFWIENPTPTSNILIVKAFSKRSLDIPKNVDTAGWKKYSDPNLGLTLSYPSDYKLTQEAIFYTQYQGLVISFDSGERHIFSIKVFSLQSGEDLAAAFERLTGVNPNIYQTYAEKVGGRQATVYRQKPGSSDNDQIYFIDNGNLYEADYSSSSVPVLATWQFQ